MKYKSCHLLEHGIFFGLDELYVCCMMPNKNSTLMPLLRRYRGEPINWEELSEKRASLRESHRNGKIITNCEGCYNLEEGEWNDGNEITNVFISHWSHCNCNCVYCYYEPKKKLYNSYRPYKIMPVLEDMLEKRVLKEGGYISFSGGEPTILDEFDEILEFFYPMDVKTIIVNSSGIKFSETLAKGIAEGKVELTVSLDCGDKELYKKIKMLDAFDTVVENLKKYASSQREKKDRLRIKYIILPGLNDSIKEAEKWLQISKDIGVNTVILDVETKWYTKNRNKIPRKINKIIDYVQKRTKELGLKLDYYSHVQQIVHERSKKKPWLFNFRKFFR